MLGKYQSLITTAIVMILSVAGLRLLPLPAHKASVKGTKIVARACTSDKTTDVECWKTYYHDLTISQGVKAAMDNLKATYDTNPTVATNCHPLTHIIGRAAGDLYGDVGKAYEQGDNYCSSGYYHGVMESIAAKIDSKDLPSKVSTICESIAAKQRYSLMHFNCVHGLGHGFMAIKGDELYQSLDLCDRLNDSWEVASCDGGVFMENVMTAYNSAFHHSNYLKPDQLLYPCTAVDDRFKDPCYLIQSSYALKELGFDYTKTFAVCAGVPEDNFRATCYQSIGRDASGDFNSDINIAHQNCMLGSGVEQIQNCAIGAVKDIVWHNQRTSEAMVFCNMFDEPTGSTCQKIALDYYKAF
jgi:hypothetical protein